MSDCISREAAQNITAIVLSGFLTDAERRFIEQIDVALGEIPAADVRPVVQGKWLLDSDPGEPWRYVCNKCGEKTTDTCMGKPRANYCPNCGADMCEKRRKHMIKVTEEMRPEKEWFEQAKQQTLETLPEFINHIMHDYGHDYGTICHAIAACALAAAWAANNDENGNITGFQSGFVMWDFIRQWQKPYNKCGMKLIDYDDFLYPQNEFKFQKTITAETYECILSEAEKRLKDLPEAHEKVKTHWQSIVDGVVPFGYEVKDE